jgi:hypothetical protein
MTMALISKRRKPFSVNDPYRKIRPTSSKIIFLSCEGSVTEEEYIVILSKIYDTVKSKIQLVSVAEDEIHTAPKGRTTEQISILGKSKPWQLIEKIDRFKEEKESIYQFSKYPEDEFWILSDIDDNLQNHPKEFQQTLEDCETKGYRYAFSNPFFEVWLLLHHDEATDDDKKYAVTDNHTYEATDHFRKRLAELKVPLKEQKHLRLEDYTDEKIRIAADRAKKLQSNLNEEYPECLGSHVYKVIDEILTMMPQAESEQK